MVSCSDGCYLARGPLLGRTDFGYYSLRWHGAHEALTRSGHGALVRCTGMVRMTRGTGVVTAHWTYGRGQEAFVGPDRFRVL